MMHFNELILNQSKKVLDNKTYAIVVATLLSIIPFASWLSVAIVVLVTLRKGSKAGFELLIPALVIHSVPLLMLVSVESALVNTLIAYVPCYFAALSLRRKANWQMVAMTFFVQALIAFVLINCLIPNFAVEQFTYFQSLLAHYDEYQQFIEQSMQGINDSDLAQLFLGIQILSVVASAIISLLFARFVQSKLFVPGGFKTELVGFRGSRTAFLVLLTVLIGSYYELAFALNLVPLTLIYFLLAGFNLMYCIFARKWNSKIAVVLFLLMMLKPMLLLFLFIIFGLLDSLFNFRLYLPGNARESI